MIKLRCGILIQASLMLVLAGIFAPANAQNVKGLNDNSGVAAKPSRSSVNKPSQFLIEPDAQIKGDNIKQHTYRSKMVGQNKNWDLDIGRFQGDYKDDLNNALEEPDNDTFSGMRLRLPFRGRTGP